MLNSEILKYLISLLILYFSFSRLSLLNDGSFYIDLIIISAITDSPNSSIIFSWIIVAIEIILAVLSFFKGGKMMILVALFYGTSLLISLVEFFVFDNYSYSVLTDNIFVSIFLRLVIVLGALGIIFDEKAQSSID